MNSESEILKSLRKKKKRKSFEEDFYFRVPYEWYALCKKHLKGGPHPGFLKPEKLEKSEVENRISNKTKDLFASSFEWDFLSSKYKKLKPLHFPTENHREIDLLQCETPKSSPADLKFTRNTQISPAISKPATYDNTFATLSTTPSFKRSFSTLTSFIKQRTLKPGKVLFWCEGDHSLLNSCLQIFFNLTQPSDFFIDRYFAGNYNSRPLSTHFAQLYLTKTMLKSGKINTSCLKNHLANSFPQFSELSITELFRLLIDELVEENQENEFLSKQVFNGKLLRETTCIVCEHEKEEEEPFSDLSLDVCTTLERSLEVFNREDRVLNFCAKCNQLTNSSQRLTIVNQPNVLVLHMKRFVFSPYLHINNMFCELKKKVVLNGAKFVLKALVSYEGEIGSGEYVFYLSANKRWTEIRGKKSVKVGTDFVLSLPGLLYIYERQGV